MKVLPIIKNRKIKIGIVGCGRISKNHFEAIVGHHKDFEIIAACDPVSEMLSAVKKTYKINCYTDLEEMLASESLDIVSICTPSGFHPHQAALCAKNGVSVVTEKPMATRWRDGVQMVRTCDENGVRLFVVKQTRMNPVIQLLKQALSEGRFGKIHLVQANVFWTRPQSYYDHGTGWRGTWEFDGGALMNQASHYVDLLDWLIGPVEKVQSLMSTFRNIEVEDTGVLNLKWRNGALGSMSVTMCTYPKNFEGSITVLGETGTVKIGGTALNKIEEWNFNQKCSYDRKVNSLNKSMGNKFQGHSMYYKNVINVMRGKAKPETDGREGLRSLELLIAAYTSSRDGKLVSLPLEL